jgi:hypothetical protein
MKLSNNAKIVRQLIFYGLLLSSVNISRGSIKWSGIIFKEMRFFPLHQNYSINCIDCCISYLMLLRQ